MLPEECRSWIDETCGPLQEAHRRLSKVRTRVSGEAVKANAEVDAIRQQIAHAESGGSRRDQTAARALLILNKANLDARPVCEMVRVRDPARSEEHTSELKSLMRISYDVLCLNTK